MPSHQKKKCIKWININHLFGQLPSSLSKYVCNTVLLCFVFVLLVFVSPEIRCDCSKLHSKLLYTSLVLLLPYKNENEKKIGFISHLSCRDIFRKFEIVIPQDWLSFLDRFLVTNACPLSFVHIQISVNHFVCQTNQWIICLVHKRS